MRQLAEILHDRCRRLSGFDFAFLAGQLYRQQNGDAIPLRDVRS
jgi:hypothetical protein